MSSTSRARRRHRLRRRHADVEEEVGAVRRPRDAPAEPTVDRAHVDDRLRASIRVLGIVLPGRDPLEHGVEDVAEPDDRVLVAPALAERGVDERPACRNPQPERAEVAENDLRLGRLAEQAHVRDAAVRDEVARARGVARGTRPLARHPTASSRSRPRRRRSARRRAAAPRRRSARAPPRRSTRALPSCSRCRGRTAARPPRTRSAGSRGRARATARARSTTCPCAR